VLTAVTSARGTAVANGGKSAGNGTSEEFAKASRGAEALERAAHAGLNASSEEASAATAVAVGGCMRMMAKMRFARTMMQGGREVIADGVVAGGGGGGRRGARMSTRA
jgi:hypothetical protein